MESYTSIDLDGKNKVILMVHLLFIKSVQSGNDLTSYENFKELKQKQFFEN